MQNRHVDDLADAYALGALEPDEVDAVERHLEGCEDCRALVEQARRSADQLLQAVPAVTPPPSLRDRLMDRITAEKQAGSGSSKSPETGDVAPNEPVRVHAPPTPTRVSYFGRMLQALRGESPSEEHAAGDLLRDLLADPHCAVWPVAGTEEAPNASARLVAAPDRRDAVFVASGLRRLGVGRAYQVWLLRGGQPLPNTLFAVNHAGVGASIVRANEPWRAFDTVAVTPEPEGGSHAPTGPIVLAGPLTP